MKNKLLILISPVIFLPIAVLSIGLGMNSLLTIIILIAYTILLIKEISK
tara:strand:- start:137 stop:283 length:147 start_codon:yes stop_codon:yes gene_type:complete